MGKENRGRYLYNSPSEPKSTETKNVEQEVINNSTRCNSTENTNIEKEVINDSACGNDKIICDSLRCAFYQVGNAFGEFCEELEQIKPHKPTHASNLTSGPLHKHLDLKSIVSRVSNYNDFDIKVKLVINGLSDGPETPWYCHELDVPASNSREFPVVDMMNFPVVDEMGSPISGLVINWTFKDSTNCQPVCRKVRVFAAGRTDLPEVDSRNSNLIPSMTLYHALWVPRCFDEDCCEEPCPGKNEIEV